MQALNNFIIIKVEKPEEKKTESGIIIHSVFHERQEFTKKNIVYAEVLAVNAKDHFLEVGDRVVINPEVGFDLEVEGVQCRIIMNHQYLAKMQDSKIVVPPKKVIVKIKKEDRESLFSKTIVRDDGSKVQLFLNVEKDEEDIAHSTMFVSIGEIVDVGKDVADVEIGDEAILDYLVDNSNDNIVYYDDNEDKYIIIDAITTFHDKEEVAYANRRVPIDKIVYKKYDMDIASPLLGLVRNHRLISRQPYCFINHANSIESRVSSTGILYEETKQVVKRRILSASNESIEQYKLDLEKEYLMQEADIFDIKLASGTIQCVYDADIMAIQ